MPSTRWQGGVILAPSGCGAEPRQRQLDRTEVHSRSSTLPATAEAADGRATASGEISGRWTRSRSRARQDPSCAWARHVSAFGSERQARAGGARGQAGGHQQMRAADLPRSTKPVRLRQTSRLSRRRRAPGGQISWMIDVYTPEPKAARRQVASRFRPGAARDAPQIALSDVRPSGVLSAAFTSSGWTWKIRPPPPGPRRSRACAPGSTATSCVFRRAGAVHARMASLDAGLALEVSTPRGQSAAFDVSPSSTRSDGRAGRRQLRLAAAAARDRARYVPRVERAEGMLGGRLRVYGALAGHATRAASSSTTARSRCTASAHR